MSTEVPGARVVWEALLECRRHVFAEDIERAHADVMERSSLPVDPTLSGAPLYLEAHTACCLPCICILRGALQAQCSKR